MASLYFRHGAMGCGKTRNLMKEWYDYNEHDQDTLIIKPARDTRGNDNVESRDGSTRKVDYLIKSGDNIYKIICNHIIDHNLDCVLVDEAQFLSREHVEQLTDVVDLLDISVICFGLRSDFQDNLFPGSTALFALADVIEGMDRNCECGNKATRNVRFENGVLTVEGEQVAIDGENNTTYKAMCRSCKKKLVKKINRERFIK